MGRWAHPESVCGCLHDYAAATVEDNDLREALLRGISETGVPTIETQWVPPAKQSLIAATFTKIAKPTLQCMPPRGGRWIRMVVCAAANHRKASRSREQIDICQRACRRVARALRRPRSCKRSSAQSCRRQKGCVEPRASPAYFNHQTNTGFTWDTSDFCRAISLVTLETSTVAHPACQIISNDDVTTVLGRCRSNGEPTSGRNATVLLSHCYLCRTNHSRRARYTVSRRSRAAY